ncbi:NAD(+)/NADH kinase [Acetivibrio ethanolgignens]|nr:NAD(+)/NADH kinase [Acetivibrio ethanolgignens]
MKKFCVVTNVEKDKGYKTARQLKELLENLGGECILVQDRFVETCEDEFIDYRDIPKDTDCIIILGGDGTLIQAAIDMHQFKIPFLGVNLGTLGFLTEIEVENLERDLKKLLETEGRIEKRMLLKGKISIQGALEEELALNDFVISKAGLCRLITLDVYVNDEWIDTYVADGLIISSPTGSTGYNLSAGGPVLVPEVPAMIITPICPHSLNKRSLVVSSQDKIKVVVGQSKTAAEDEAVVIPDGSCTGRLVTGDWMEICPAKDKVQLVRLKEMSLLGRLRQKLGRELE